MKKIYLFLLIGLALTQVCAAQEPKITFYDWDGVTPLGEEDTLKILVGETREIKYSIEPEDYDLSRYHLTFTRNPDDERYLTVVDNNAVTWEACTGYVGFYRKPEYVVEGESQLLDHAANIAAVYRASGPLFENPEEVRQVYYSIDKDWRLEFWCEELDSSKLADNTNYYTLADYFTRDEAPWYKYHDSIKEIALNNIDRVGKLNFCDMSKIHYVKIMDNIKYLGDSVFFGCSNLTLEVNRYEPNEVEGPTPEESNPNITKTTGVSLVLGNDMQGDTIRPDLLIVRSSDYTYQLEAINNYSGDADRGNEWSKCGAVTEGDGYVSVSSTPVLFWSLGQSDSLGTVCLKIDNLDPSNPVSIPKPGPNVYYGWQDLGEVVKELKITDGISYIDAFALYRFSGLQAIRFNQINHPLDSIHVDAFSPSIRPWKFEMGDPLDGAVRPPKIIGDSSIWTSIFKDSTVLYVPDSLVDDGKGGKIKCVELYRGQPSWSSAFNRITDRTVDTAQAENKMILRWLPLEDAKGYQLTVTELNCTESTCTATVFVPATGKRGVVDWGNMEADIPAGIAARRAPQGEGDEGGLVLTISIKTGSGEAHNSDVEAQVSGVKEKTEYTYTRTVLGEGMEKFNKIGSFISPDKTTTGLQEIDPISNLQSPISNIYDLLGRPLGTSLDALSDGIYIIDNGTKRTTILLRR